MAEAICAEEVPELVERGTGHPAACHFAGESQRVAGSASI
jgi:oligopeptide transport system ATP-binding protein